MFPGLGASGLASCGRSALTSIFPACGSRLVQSGEYGVERLVRRDRRVYATLLEDDQAHEVVELLHELSHALITQAHDIDTVFVKQLLDLREGNLPTDADLGREELVEVQSVAWCHAGHGALSDSFGTRADDAGDLLAGDSGLGDGGEGPVMVEAHPDH